MADRDNGERIYTYTNYTRRVRWQAVIVSCVILVVFALTWFTIDAVLEHTVFSMLRETALSQVKSSQGKLLQSVVDNSQVPAELRVKVATSMVSMQSASIVLSEDQTTFIRVIVRIIVYTAMLVVLVLSRMYTKNNPDVLLSSMGTLSKKVLRAGIEEDLRREEIAARMEQERRSWKENLVRQMKESVVSAKIARGQKK